MKKKLLVLSLCVALAAIAIAGASLAYFTDTKSAKNTFTVGNVKIDLIESRYHREGNGNSGDITIGKPTHEVTADDNMKYVDTKHTMFTDDEIKEDAEGYKTYLEARGNGMVPGRNAAKCPYVVNTGANDAYIRIRVMIPSAADNDGTNLHTGGVIASQWCSTSMISGEFAGDAKNWPAITKTTVGNIEYNVYTFVRNEPLEAGKMTEWNVWNYIGLDKNATAKDIQTAINAGAIIKKADGTMTFNVLVQADAIQAEGFANATAAFAAFDAKN